jgi:hypothetical protein
VAGPFRTLAQWFRWIGAGCDLSGCCLHYARRWIGFQTSPNGQISSQQVDDGLAEVVFTTAAGKIVLGAGFSKCQPQNIAQQLRYSGELTKRHPGEFSLVFDFVKDAGPLVADLCRG